MLFLCVLGCQESVRGGDSGKGPVTQGWGERRDLGTRNSTCVPTARQGKGGAPGDFWGLHILPSSGCLKPVKPTAPSAVRDRHLRHSCNSSLHAGATSQAVLETGATGRILQTLQIFLSNSSLEEN